MIAELLAGVLSRAVAEAQGAGLMVEWEEGRGDPRLRQVPPPMIPGNAEAATALCAIHVRSHWAPGLAGGAGRQRWGPARAVCCAGVWGQA